MTGELHDPTLLDALEGLESTSWKGQAFRYILGDYWPLNPNTRGARWNSSKTSALYFALKRETTLAEARHRLSLEPVRPRLDIHLYKMRVTLENVLDLGSTDALRGVGVGQDGLRSLKFGPCQAVGDAVAWLGHDGLFVPSARHEGKNLVVFQVNQHPAAEIEVLDKEVLEIADLDL